MKASIIKKNWLGLSIFVSIALSLLLGILFENNAEVVHWLSPLGQIYLNLVKLIMLPLVISSLILGVANMTSVAQIGKMGGLTLLFFLCTTSISVLTGLIISNVIRPGFGVNADSLSYEVQNYPNILDQIVSIFPSNAVQSFIEGNLLQIILISIVFGCAIVKAPTEHKYIINITEEIFEVMCIITRWVINLTPVGILGLMTPIIAQNGISIIFPLIKLILAFYTGFVIQVVLVYFTIIKTMTTYSVKDFFKGMYPALAVAFATCSSAAALPVSLERIQNELKVSKEVSSFVLPLGNTINMDGNALYQGVVALFIAQAYGIELSVMSQFIVIITGTVASIGAAGVPGAGMIVLSTVLASVGLPVEGIVLVAGVDRILDMGRTVLNVTSDAIASVVVEKVLYRNE